MDDKFLEGACAGLLEEQEEGWWVAVAMRTTETGEAGESSEGEGVPVLVVERDVECIKLSCDSLRESL